MEFSQKYERCKDCEYLHRNGNCLKVGGFYSSVDDKDCIKIDASKENTKKNDKNSNYKYSLIAKEYLEMLDKTEPNIEHKIISWGNLQMMEELFDLFGGDRNKICDQTSCIGHHYRFKYVMDRLDRENKKEAGIFVKGYIHYKGIINRPTRCFTLRL